MHERAFWTTKKIRRFKIAQRTAIYPCCGWVFTGNPEQGMLFGPHRGLTNKKLGCFSDGSAFLKIIPLVRLLMAEEEGFEPPRPFRV
jgi:hypothetical protein